MGTYKKERGLQLRCSICSDGDPSGSLYLQHSIHAHQQPTPGQHVLAVKYG